MSDSVVIQLTRPLAFGSDTIDCLTVRRPKARDFRAITSSAPFAVILDLAAALTHVPARYLDELDVDDFTALSEVVGGFLPQSPGTGKTSSAT